MPSRAKILLKLLRVLGPLAALGFVGDEILRRVSKARVLFVALREPEMLAGLDPMLPPGLTAEVRRADQLGKLSPACADALGADFLAEARGNGAEAVVILDGGAVVSFQWHSDKPTWAYDDIWIAIGPNYLYGYNTFTAPTHRGRGLNFSGLVIAARTLALSRGKGLAGYVMGNNIGALLAHSRISPKDFGIVWVWPHGKQGLRTFASGRLRAAGFQLVRKAESPALTALKAGGSH